MMKLFFLLGLISMNFEIMLLLGSVILLMSLMELMSISVESLSSHDNLVWSLVILSAWICMLMILANFKVMSKSLFSGLVEMSLILLLLCFAVKSILSFYFYFEAVLIPIFLLVMGWGYQPERLSAAFYMFFYTLVASLPLLLAIVFLMGEMGSMSTLLPPLTFSMSNNVLLMMLVMAFMVKFPIYFFHLWLPKAHVEAPVSGSMILAGVLLKLGGYGLFITMMFSGCNMLVNSILSTTAIVGAAALSMMILRMADMKVAIAYSSVVHMSMVIVVFSSNSMLGLVGGLWMMIAHGITSSGMFSAANMMYERSHSRSLINNKGVLSLMPFFTMLWFMLIVLNFAGPFTINLFSEILMISSLMSMTWFWSIMIGAICFFSAAYNLNLYASTQQGQTANVGTNFNSFNTRESLTLVSHVWPAVILLLSLVL
uniref:NADH dehydrogenase subunit 4 n=1 Tax=Labidocera rotunda TaxID=207950 RepID=UPI002037121A|nr:NADH dehydrogenase subunit 4 [Labidocera rotunda]URC16608.1 NADH dehydrogenase subunit 4 [Labidocera rotunda]